MFAVAFNGVFFAPLVLLAVVLGIYWPKAKANVQAKAEDSSRAPRKVTLVHPAQQRLEAMGDDAEKVWST